MQARLIAWLKERGIGFWLLTTVVGTMIGWGVTQAMPVLWRSITKPDPVSVLVEPSPRGITDVPRLPKTTEERPKRPDKKRVRNDGVDPSASADGEGSGEAEASDAKLAAIRTESDPTIFEKDAPDWTGYTWVVPMPPEELSPPPKETCRDRRPWALELGGADAAFTVVQAIVEGRARGTVVIDGLEVEIVERDKPLAGTWAQCPVGGADASPHTIWVDLDRTPPAVEYFKEGGRPRPRLTLTLTPGEVEIFQIWAFTARCYCRWRLKLLLVEGGKRRELVVDDDGEPFRTTGTGRAVPALWQRGAWVRTTN